jgi:hypothetical protein
LAGEDLLTYTGQAAIAYQDALMQARNAQNALLRQYGFVAPSASGNYSVEGAQAAFDPNTLFNKSTGGVDAEALKQAMSGIRAGGTGVLADIGRSGAGAEADVVAEARSRGFGGDIGGGLTSQRRQLAEAQTRGQLGQAKNEFISALSQGLSPIGGAWQQLQTAQAQDTADRLAAEAAKNSVVNASMPTEAPAGSAPSTPPKNAKNYQRWTNPVSGQKMQFVNGKWRKA